MNAIPREILPERTANPHRGHRSWVRRQHQPCGCLSGTSEIRNWIVVAGAMEASDLEMELVDYIPCYRTEAGTGCAMAFAEWQ